LSEKSSFSSKRSSQGLVWVVYFCLGLCLVYSLFYLANYFGLSFFVLTNRGMYEHTVVGSVLSGSLDTVVWSVGVPVVIAWLFFTLGLRLIRNLYQLLSGIGLFGVLFGFGIKI
jgi:hypothetical protein